MDKKELLAVIYEEELQRLNNLSYSAVVKEVESWFNEKVLPNETQESLIQTYMRDYMRWQEDASKEELEQIVFQEIDNIRKMDRDFDLDGRGDMEL